MYGGHTPMGRELNNLGSRTDDLRTRQAPPPRQGVIKDILITQGIDQYQVVLRFLNSRGQEEESPPLPLIDHPSTIAALYGSPKDLIGRYECRVEYHGPSTRRGVAKIVRSSRLDTEEAATWNELDIQGAAFAPPGSGF